MDLVSVIIPYYKKKTFIRETIFSVLKQSYQNLEIIVIYDDQNLDDLDFIKEIANLDSRISILINKKNLGAGLSRNKGIDYSKGTYIAFLDSDDVWKVDKIKKQVNFMKNNNLQASHTSYEIFDNKNQIVAVRIARNFYEIKDLLKSCDIGLSTVMLKKEIIFDNFKFPDLKTKEDFVVWLNLLKNEIIIGGLDEKLTIWKKTDSSLSSSILQKLTDGYSVYHKYMKFNSIKSIYYLLCLSINFLKK
jgi:teichuronic acid biosynthesis glycosyltransferase TuaG